MRRTVALGDIHLTRNSPASVVDDVARFFDEHRGDREERQSGRKTADHLRGRGRQRANDRNDFDISPIRAYEMQRRADAVLHARFGNAHGGFIAAQTGFGKQLTSPRACRTSGA